MKSTTIIIAIFAVLATLTGALAYPYGYTPTWANPAVFNGGYGNVQSYPGYTYNSYGGYNAYSPAAMNYNSYNNYNAYGASSYGMNQQWNAQSIPPQGYYYMMPPSPYGNPIQTARADYPGFRGDYSGFTGGYESTWMRSPVPQYGGAYTPTSIPARYYPNTDVVQPWN